MDADERESAAVRFLSAWIRVYLRPKNEPLASSGGWILRQLEPRSERKAARRDLLQPPGKPASLTSDAVRQRRTYQAAKRAASL